MMHQWKPQEPKEIARLSVLFRRCIFEVVYAKGMWLVVHLSAFAFWQNIYSQSSEENNNAYVAQS